MAIYPLMSEFVRLLTTEMSGAKGASLVSRLHKRDACLCFIVVCLTKKVKKPGPGLEATLHPCWPEVDALVSLQGCTRKYACGRIGLIDGMARKIGEPHL